MNIPVTNNEVENLSEIFQKINLYYQGVENSDLELLEKVFHEEWKMLDNNVLNESNIRVESKIDFLNRLKNIGSIKDYSADREIITVDILKDKLSVVRVDKMPNMHVSIFFMIKFGEEWLILDKVWVKEIVPNFNNCNDYNLVEQVIASYFKQIQHNDKEGLKSILDENWELKSIFLTDRVELKKKFEFLQNIDTKAGYNNRLVSIDVFHDSLSIVKLDNNTDGFVSYLTLFKVSGEWKIANERKVFVN
ncbi:putative lumazine-binding protein [Flavobacterium sp. 90]|uniref:nuclear transport factor 2 family protein n=1 Tax=unclassified Flavobacterium TaxID=196869 RepID=UPI000EB3E280|nr:MULTISPECIES: nuclear transport factor 2 family protein [unclassified Flavobacterium]RKR04565.1 putative lumazine-binding protein [Flavobacterium sp. 81]TCK55894.1 putative lumazine-binding protein [Flavobacterium sp. 90]